jgi:hypothetical protein
MASFTINYPDGMGQRILDGFCSSYGYQDQIRTADNQLIPNPETKAEFLKRKVGEFVKSAWKSAEVAEAKRAAAATITDIDDVDIS